MNTYRKGKGVRYRGRLFWFARASFLRFPQMGGQARRGGGGPQMMQMAQMGGAGPPGLGSVHR
jgi:hypothetical protein